MGRVVRFPNCREISPEASRIVAKRTRESSYWVRRWSEINKRLYEAEPEDFDENAIAEASQYMMDWLYQRNRAALRARGF